MKVPMKSISKIFKLTYNSISFKTLIKIINKLAPILIIHLLCNKESLPTIDALFL
jgi:hypothetical protein